MSPNDKRKAVSLIKEVFEELGINSPDKPRFKARLAPEPSSTRPNKINRGGGSHPFFGNKGKSNSVWDIVDYLKDNPGSSEGEIFAGAFDYSRGGSGESNKKYADLLRRALSKGLIQRAEKTAGFGRTRFVYFLPGSRAAS